MISKLDDLRRQKIELQDRVKQLADIGPQIASLERNKDLEEQNYKYYSGTLQKARVDEALDPSKMPNISAIQRPSPPGIVTKTRDKIALGLAGGGLALGLGLALLFELVFNHSYKRRSEVELQLRSPVMLSIPYQGTNGRRLRLPWKNGQRAGKEAPAKSKPRALPGSSASSAGLCQPGSSARRVPGLGTDRERVSLLADVSRAYRSTDRFCDRNRYRNR